MSHPAPKNSAWLNTAETVLLTSSIGTLIASVVLQQVTFAAITSVQLSLVVGLNSWSRKRLDDLNQQNHNAIAQIQQQFLKKKDSFAQIEAITRQLPSYQDITTLQHQLERLKTDCQQFDRLNQAIQGQEALITHTTQEIIVLQEAIKSNSFVNLEFVQSSIHSLKADFEIIFIS